MARHRNVRNLNYDDFDDDYVYGHSVEDDCISPTDAQQWLYDRARGQNSMASFLANHRDIEEEDEHPDLEPSPKHERRDSDAFTLPDLPDEEKAKLLSCMDEIRGIIGDTSVNDRLLVETIMRFEYDCAKALDYLLDSSRGSSSREIPEQKVVKKPEELIEKDFLNKIVQNPPRFKIPPLKSKTEPETTVIKPEQNNTPAPTNLAELANLHLSNVGVANSGTKLFLPQLKKGIGPPGLGGGLGTKLFIPKLGLKTKTESGPVLKPAEPVPCVDDTKPCPEIDLSSALLNTLVLTPKETEPTQTLIESKIIAKADIIKLMKTLNLEDVNCEIDTRYLLSAPIAIKTRKRSSVGRIITRHYRIKSSPYSVRHVFKVTMEKENLPKRFNFLTPSPDDIILEHLKKNAKKP